MMDEAIDLDALRTSIRDVLAAECPPDAVLKHVEQGGGTNGELWKTAASLGWTALALPETYGGLGLGLDALGVLYEEAGRAVAPIPLLSTLLAADAIERSGSDVQKERWLGSIAAGESRAALSAPAAFGSPLVTVREEGGKLVLSGAATGILDGADADLLLILASRPDGSLARIAIERGDGVAVERRQTWDGTRSLASLDLDGVRLPGDRLLPATTPSEEALAQHAALGLAADSVGGSETVLAITIEYLQTRQQFGKAIGSFQGLKHRIANLKAALVGDSLLVASAAALAAAGDPLAPAEISAAKAQACRDYVELGRDAIQLHGGIGFTAEHVCHLFLKRARLNEALFGAAPFHLDRLVDHLRQSVAA